MRTYARISTLIVLAGPLFLVCCHIGDARVSGESEDVAIVCSPDATSAEHLAAKEVRRYLYLRTGRLPVIVEAGARPAWGNVSIVVGQKGSPAVRLVTGGDRKRASAVDSLKREQYLLKTIKDGERTTLLIAGGDPIGTLYGAYRFAEHLGVRFYLHGDTVPDERMGPVMPELDERGEALFEVRGIQPFHDFPEGPDWWNADDYKAILAQLPKLRMNFFGLHTYPQGGVGPEPTVWIGMPGEFNEDGTVKAGYPSRHFTTANVTGAWGYKPAKTSDYSFGAAEMFERDDYGADYMRGMNPWTQLSPEKGNELFDRMGELLRDVFEYAHLLGIKTCVGTETPLVVPDAVKDRIKASGKNPADPAVVQEVYEGLFGRISKAYPLDYYWFWTPEGCAGGGDVG